MSEPNLSDLVDSMKTQNQLLLAASGITANGEEDTRDGVLRQHLTHSAELVRGAASLGHDQNSTCLGIVARSLLEVLISALWVTISTDNAEAQMELSTGEIIRALRVNLKSGKAKMVNRHSGKNATDEFLKDERFRNIKKRKNVVEQATEAGVLDLYNIFYRFLSMETHGHNKVKKDLVDDPQAMSSIHIQGMGAISLAIGHVCVRWLLHRERTDNESLREILGLNRPNP